jgi:hypothetical protein
MFFSISKRNRARGQAVAEVLLIGPLVAFILVTAVYVGTYFYSLSVSQALSYSNSMHYSFSGNPEMLSDPDFSSAQESLIYWNEAVHQNQATYENCLTTPQVIRTTLSINTPDPPASSLIAVLFSNIAASPSFGNILARSVSIAYRPLYGGVDPTLTGMLCQSPQTKTFFTAPVQSLPPGAVLNAGQAGLAAGGLGNGP